MSALETHECMPQKLLEKHCSMIINVTIKSRWLETLDLSLKLQA